MRLIDADELQKFPIRIDTYDKENGNLHFVLGIESVLEYVDNMPTVDAEPVKHGTWSEQAIRPTSRGVDEIGYYCSECGYFESYTAKYCAGCGAKMDGGADDA